MSSMSSLGLIMITVAWLLQFLLISYKDKTIQNLFLFIYGLGSMVLVYDAAVIGMTESAVLNLAIAALSAAVLFKVNSR